ncbi:MAG TPA: TolC family protein, partial [Puia sp.]|nr:TolC family protein [Puia sp.]
MAFLPCIFYLLSILTVPALSFGQGAGPADSLPSFTLQQCVDYALQHQPMVNQAFINQQITRASNAIALSGWLPQVNVTGNLTHYNTLPTVFVKDPSGNITEQKTGVINTAIPILSVSQTIFNPALLFAAKSAPLYVNQSEQITDSTKIGAV